MRVALRCATGGPVNIKLDRFDYFVLTGGLVNVIVIAYLLGYWVLH